MGEIGAEDLENCQNLQGTGNREERILVLVRLRPLNENEISRNEVVDWECINSTTILYRNSLHERSGLPTAYSLDRVFSGDCTTREVYEDGTKDIALSVLGGINSTIFAYGQTSSGKTYTMNGITEYTVADIYNYIQRHEERAFVLKFSAMEIYNEVVRDLLSMDNTPLRMLDDPERGTIVEKLNEEILRDWNHLKELLTICEAQRQTGETLLNETSSRSHQILKLTIESSAREFLGKGNSTTLAASVNFVDLAGSERASQALSVGQRLKEGCHINRSLLTLGTVIRKLSKGTHGHINYRDSKLTRILQPSLGGNARTAIICTLTPARSHVEQSRNTLLFASCAKEVSTNAKVNVVMSDKALVKQLQKALARLEGELRTPGSTCDHAALLRKKDMQIDKLEKEIRELKKQRNLAHSQIEDLIRTVQNYEGLQKFNVVESVNGDFRHNGSLDPLFSESGEDHHLSDDLFDPRKGMEEPQTEIVEDSDDTCKKVRCIEVDESDQEKMYDFHRSTVENEESRNDLIVEHESLPVLPTLINDSKNCCSYGLPEPKFQDVQKTIDSPIPASSDSISPGASSTNMTSSGGLKLTRSQSCRANSITVPLDFEMPEQIESTPPTVLDQNFTGRPEGGFLRKHWKLPPAMYASSNLTLPRNDSQSSESISYMDETKYQNFNQMDEEIPTLGSFVAGLREMAKLQFDNQASYPFQETEKRDENNTGDVASDQAHEWPWKFKKLQKSIVDLWQACNVSLVHRTYFILLIKDDFTDSIYMEVEYRRLSFLRERFSSGHSAVHNGHTLTLASSKKALRRERKTLSRLMYKRYTEDEIRRFYEEWDIDVNSKQRRLQLVNVLWSDTKNMDHITKSAGIVAKLIGFSEDEQALKEMLGLSFTLPRMSRRSFSWKNSMASLL